MTESSESTGGSMTVTAECAKAGEELTAISGGAAVSDSSDGSVSIVETRPTGIKGEVPSAWMAKAEEVGESSESWTLTVYAVCARVKVSPPAEASS